MRLTKKQTKELVKKRAPDYLEFFNDFQTYDGGWIKWPGYLINIKRNFKLDFYVTLYENEKSILSCFVLYLFDKDEFNDYTKKFESLPSPEREKQLAEFVTDLDDYIDEDTQNLYKDFPLSPEKEKAAIEEFERLPPEEKEYTTKKSQYFWLGVICTMHNYFAVMVTGEKMTELVPKAMQGDDNAYLKAVKIDRNLLTNHPYFKERYEQAQANGESDFLRQLGFRQSTPNLQSKIRYPGLYFIFSMLDALEWLDDFKHEEILDLCDEAGLDRWQNRIEDVNAVTKQLRRYRDYQKSGGISRYSDKI